MPKTTDLISTAEAATRSGKSVRTLTRWVELGKLTPAVKMPGRTGAMLFDPADIEALAEATA